VSLPDGKLAPLQPWTGHRIPPLANGQAAQRGHPADALAFFNELVPAWLTSTRLDEVARRYAAPAAAAEVASRLKAWRVRDHGRIAGIAHAPTPMPQPMRARLEAVLKEKDALARYESPADAVFPMLPKSADAQPLGPFVLESIPADASGNERILALVKLRHAPYDTVGLVARRDAGLWRIVAVVATVDH
jgi:hypothetical protein